jgi:Beta-propeller repeat
MLLFTAALGCAAAMSSAWAQSSSTNPVVSYATFFGGGSADYYESEGGYGIALGPGGAVYVLGYTGSADSFPLTNRFGPDWQGFGTFVIKYDPTARTVLYSSLIRGCWGRAIAVDAAGNAYITGHAAYYTATTNAFQADFQGGNYDAFVAKLSADGSSLLYCTFLGGENEEVGRRIIVDGAGQAIVTGTTASTNFPVTAGVAQPRLAGTWNAFVTKLDASGSNLVFSTYLGGDCFDYGMGLALDSSNNVYVSGSSCSTNFSATPHPLFLGTNELGADAFVAKLSPDGRAVRWVTFFGGDGDQLGSALALDGAGNAYVFGQTSASNFPVTAGCLQGQFGGGAWDNFVVKLNASGSNLVYATYLGGASADDQREDINLRGYPLKASTPICCVFFRRSVSDGHHILWSLASNGYPP